MTAVEVIDIIWAAAGAICAIGLVGMIIYGIIQVMK